MSIKKRLGFSNQVPWWFLLPALLLLLITSIGPFLYGMAISLFHFRFVAEPGVVQFVGFKNYIYEFFSDSVFPIALLNTIRWVAVVDAGSFCIGLFLAIQLNKEFRGRKYARVMAWLPWAVPLITVNIIWTLIYQPYFGLLNGLLSVFGLNGQRWLSEPGMALYAVAFAQVWRWTPFFTITLLAGLQTIPNEMYEAGMIDGATQWQSFRFITLPLLRSTAGLTLLIGTIWAFKTFTLVYGMTGGGPANRSQVLSTWCYQLAFRFGYLDRGAVVGTVMAFVLMIIGITWIQSEMTRFRREK